MKKTKIKYYELYGIGNYYGGLTITQNKGKYYWLIRDWDDDINDLSIWTEIDKELYDSLCDYQIRKYSKLVDQYD